VFNPGAVRFGDQYVLLLRVQNRGRETYFVVARSTDGITFSCDNRIVELEGITRIAQTVFHVYDPRITRLDDRFYIMVAMDLDAGCYLGLAETKDFESFRFLGIVSGDEFRNGVLFPEKIGGRYLRLDRPNRVSTEGGVRTGSAICLSESDDLLHWSVVATVMEGRPHYWDELIGSGPPPVKTRAGWLHIYHGVATHFGSASVYQAGVTLLDLDNPSIVLARSRFNILEPREIYEQVGQVPNVVFPSGMIVDTYDSGGYATDDSRVLVYYGAADTSVGLAETTIRELIAACYEGGERD